MKNMTTVLVMLVCLVLYSCDNKNRNTNNEVEKSVDQESGPGTDNSGSAVNTDSLPSSTGPGENNGAQSGAGTPGDTSVLSSGQGSGTGSGSMGSGEVTADSAGAEKSK
jgi:hypothetical protein